MYVKVKETEVLIVFVYVDDLVYTTNSVTLLEDFGRMMINEFEMTNLGLMSYFLGLEIKKNGNGIFLSQEKYVNDLLEKFQMQNCNPLKTPLIANHKFSLEDGEERVDGKMYQSLILVACCI